jgi:hypothetical protein
MTALTSTKINILYIQLRETFNHVNFVSERDDDGEKHFTYCVEKNTDELSQVRQLTTLLDTHIMDAVHIEENVISELADSMLEYLVRHHSHV